MPDNADPGPMSYEDEDLAPPADAQFKLGERVVCKFGAGTIIHVYAKHPNYRQHYRIKLDSSASPPEYGHNFAENELEAESPQISLL